VSTSRFAGNMLSVAALAALISTCPLQAYSPIEGLRDQAAHHEKNFEWDKALAIYDALLRDARSPELQNRYNTCLRRLWQTLRHQDIGYRKEVLGLDYGQALRLYNKMRDTLLDHALDRKRADPTRLLNKGLEELDAALANPVFCQTYLPGKQLEVLAFREYLKRKWGGLDRLTRPQAEKQIREIALAAQDMLRLNPTVTILELACGACYAFDDYTAYLTPSQFRQLYDSLRGETREGVALRSVIYDLKNGVGYIKMLSFQDSTLAELDAALDSFKEPEVKGLVLDLRGNPGGLLEVAVEAAKRFLAAGVIVGVENQDAKLSAIYQARPMGVICALPLVVLVDGDTASAAEVLAGALKDNDRARVVGQTTFGKGCSQTLVKLPAAGGVPTGGLRVTIARFFSPRGVCYTGRGVVPDIVADRYKPDAPDVDNQFSEALADLERQLAMR
jgi:hypothetical protein